MMTRSMTRRIAELEKENEKLKECPCEAFEKLMIDNLAAQMMTCCARVHEHTRRLNTKPYYCDWCATRISDDDDNTFWCGNDTCHKVVCGREGCSSNLAYYACCEECEESAYQDSEDESDDDEEQD